MNHAGSPAPANLVRFRDLALRVVRSLPQSPRIVTGVATLLRTRFSEHFSVGMVLEDRARRHPDATLLLAGDRHWTYAEFNAWVNRLAHVFRQDGIGNRSVVALLMENHPLTLACVMALAKLGAIAGMLNPHLRGDALRHSVRTMKPARLVVAGECLPQFAGIGWDGPPPYWSQGHGDAPAPDGWPDLEAQSAQAPAENPETTTQVETGQPCFYILTSGTTGMPKASVMSHRRWLRGMAGIGHLALRLQPNDIFYCALPLYHNNALTVSWGAVLSGGSALALDRKFSASRFWDRVRHYRATAFVYIGELCRYLLAQPESPDDRRHAVRVCIGNGLRAEIWHAFKSRFGIEHICEFYGASEGNLVFINSFKLDATAGYCPLSHAIVECDPATAEPQRDAKGRLIEVGPGGIGLLVNEVTDSSPFDGYTDSKASDARLIRDAFKKGDCWFNTGDLVRNQGWGHIQFVDRLGDTFRWKGENVATTEVEGALMSAPGVADGAVYGVQVPHADGRAGMAAVCLEAGARFDGAAVAAHLRMRLPDYAVPLFVRLVPELSRTSTFKTVKQALRDQGADPGLVSDPLYLLAPGASAYETLDTTQWRNICDGRLKL
jgi:acyl-CoA synthetase (AMP-forming)/AMP-acid ligase II